MQIPWQNLLTGPAIYKKNKQHEEMPEVNSSMRSFSSRPTWICNDLHGLVDAWKKFQKIVSQMAVPRDPASPSENGNGT